MHQIVDKCRHLVTTVDQAVGQCTRLVMTGDLTVVRGKHLPWAARLLASCIPIGKLPNANLEQNSHCGSSQEQTTQCYMDTQLMGSVQRDKSCWRRGRDMAVAKAGWWIHTAAVAAVDVVAVAAYTAVVAVAVKAEKQVG